MLQRIYLIRHGETDWNREGRAQGQHDVPLNEIGREQACCLGNYLSNVHPSVIICSDLSRARETAELIGKPSGLAPRVFPELRERNMGEYSGLTDREIRDKGISDLTRWDGIAGVESDAEILSRVTPCLDRFIQENQGEGVVVSHGGVIKVLLYHWLGIESHRPRGFLLRNGLMVVLRPKNGVLLMEGFVYPELLNRMT